MPTSTAPYSPGVRFPPPALFLAGLLVGWLLHFVWALPIIAPGSTVRLPLAVAMILLGLALSGWGLITFRRARTTFIPHRPASRLVTGGPYRFTRNPMYVGMSLTYLGFTLVINSAWPLLTFPLVIVALIALVIQREEYYLSSAFGEEYRDYTRRVRRWL